MKVSNRVAGHDKYGRPYHHAEVTEDRRVFMLTVDGELVRVGKFVSEVNALHNAKEHSRKTGQPVGIKQVGVLK